MIAGLDGAPRRVWPDAAVHHGARALALAGLAVAVAALFPPDAGPRAGRFEEGTAMDRDVLAEIAFTVPKDAAVLADERAAAAAAVVPTFERRGDAAGSAVAAVAGFFARVDSAAAQSGTAGIAAVLARAGIAEAGPAHVQALAQPEAAQRLYRQAASAFRILVPGGVTSPGAMSGVSADSLRVVRDGAAALVARGTVRSAREFYDRAVQDLSAGPETDLLRMILAHHLVPSLVLDQARVERDRAAAREAVSPTRAEVVEGEAVVRAYQRIGPAELQRLAAYGDALRAAGLGGAGFRLGSLLGGTILNALLLGAFGLLTLLFMPAVYRSFRALMTVAGMFAVYFLAAFLIDQQGWPPSALPISFVAISVALLWDGRMAALAALVLASLTVLQPPFGETHAFAVVATGGVAASLTARAFRRLSQVWLYIALIAAVYAAAILALQLRGAEFEWAPYAAGALGSAVAGALLSVGFLPVFEWLTGVTTESTLIGWADPNRPLMRRLAERAPGTFAHTMQVAALSEAGAGAVGARGLLCRAGAYYHDVGKLVHPEYFIENQHGDNPHDAMSPAASAAAVRSHVTNGVKLVRRHRVPGIVAAFVAEHHGDLPIGSFLHKAKEQADAEGADPPAPEFFHYPGPRPQSRETAIVMLADAAESAARVLRHPSEERIERLVARIVSDRLGQGQLDDSGLTLRDLSVLKKRFVGTLAGAYHRRIDYPGTRELTDAEPGADAVPAATSDAAPPEPDAPKAAEPLAVAPDGSRSGPRTPAPAVPAAASAAEPLAVAPDAPRPEPRAAADVGPAADKTPSDERAE